MTNYDIWLKVVMQIPSRSRIQAEKGLCRRLWCRVCSYSIDFVMDFPLKPKSPVSLLLGFGRNILISQYIEVIIKNASYGCLVLK